ncbi:NAD(P)-dependent oxidoreductase [Mesorhizobium sp.]|uniref:NAD-dependent epimerase/dehydratase family protein n=1 Tax=Mesorhizobium sp. TaxID=1871066 RepID=UPI0012143B48|nr:NAD(P)-dependent oxidoreductase [Mesorhizobium sp.]TIO09982.1 MAG: NAD(P)-dependent oxidoreductase [Mesorhizobium sp.]TIO32508.1 MAG: NAD(P)-dependent oxidoreductase [Mesorhizobium sp.]TIP09504.1 MAG: NAD(P)-dependent oxidoreductase [Mesorhizobium sp.]
MRTIVTGSSGLLGRHVAAALVAAGHDVMGVDAVAPDKAAWRHASADLTDLGSTLQLVRDCDAVVHIAAIPRPTGRAGGEVFKTNVATAYNVVEAAAMAGARRFVYASSFSVFGYPFFEKTVRPPYLPVDMNHPVGAQDPYALSKWLGEEIVDAAVRRGAFSAVSIRMPWIQTPETFFAGVGPRRATADSARDLWAYLDARDAGQGFLQALEWQGDGHLRVLLSAADTFMEEETEPLVRRVYPDVALSQPIAGHGAVLDTGDARETIGFEPSHSWRSYPQPESGR